MSRVQDLDNGNPVVPPGYVLAPGERGEILQGLGELALAASSAERDAAQALHFLLTNTLDDPIGTSRAVKEINGMAKICQLLALTLPNDIALRTLLEDARDYVVSVAIRKPSAIYVNLDHEFLQAEYARAPHQTPVDYLFRIKARYDRRNECLHAFDLDETVTPHRLVKGSPEKGYAKVSETTLAEVCTSPPTPLTLRSVIGCIAHELKLASLYLPTIAVAARWRRSQLVVHSAT